MILNKEISLILSCCFYFLLVMIASMAIMMFVPGGSLPFVGVIVLIAFYFITKVFYSYLRNDEFYKNNKEYSSDNRNEKYITKGEKDSKKIFIIIWVIVILLLTAVTMVLFLKNKGLI